MLIAQQKKQENIIEYLLYMWQIEDLIRANELDIDKIKTTVVDQYTVNAEMKLSIFQWYKDLIDMMQLENLRKTGHLQVLINVMNDLNELHRFLLNSPKEVDYHARFVAASPELSFLRKKIPETENPNDVFLAINALYGYLMLKLSKKTISEGTQDAVNKLSKFLVVLTKKYHERENAEQSELN